MGAGGGRTAHAGTGERIVARSRASGRTAHAGGAVGAVARTRPGGRARSCAGLGATGVCCWGGWGGWGSCCRRGWRSWGHRGHRGRWSSLRGSRGRNRWCGRRLGGSRSRGCGGRLRCSGGGVGAQCLSRRLGLPRGGSCAGLGCRGRGWERLTQLALDGRLDGGCCRLHVLAIRVQPRDGVLAGNTQLLGQCADPGLRHVSPRLGPGPWCLSGHGPLVAGGHAHSSELIECSYPFRSSTVEVRPVLRVRGGFDPLAHGSGVQGS